MSDYSIVRAEVGIEGAIEDALLRNLPAKHEVVVVDVNNRMVDLRSSREQRLDARQRVADVGGKKLCL